LIHVEASMMNELSLRPPPKFPTASTSIALERFLGVGRRAALRCQFA
jgi:hypothetical protein